MKAKLLDNLRKHEWRQYLKVLALVVFWTSVGVLSWNAFYMFTDRMGIPAPQATTADEDLPTTLSEELAPETLVATQSEPRMLRIPSLNLEVPFEEPLGLDEQGAVGVPNAYDTVGWYKFGPTPGELGPAVILGHVDSLDGPAVFYSLGQVSAGDRVSVDRADGSTAVFEITSYERVEQVAFPTERVYGSIPYAGIRLITCSGTYDKGELRYSHNLIVYGKLVDIEGNKQEN